MPTATKPDFPKYAGSNFNPYFASAEIIRREIPSCHIDEIIPRGVHVRFKIEHLSPNKPVVSQLQFGCLEPLDKSTYWLLEPLRQWASRAVVAPEPTGQSESAYELEGGE